jgi:hypothetical protein
VRVLRQGPCAHERGAATLCRQRLRDATRVANGAWGARPGWSRVAGGSALLPPRRAARRRVRALLDEGPALTCPLANPPPAERPPQEFASHLSEDLKDLLSQAHAVFGTDADTPFVSRRRR